MVSVLQHSVTCTDINITKIKGGKICTCTTCTCMYVAIRKPFKGYFFTCTCIYTVCVQGTCTFQVLNLLTGDLAEVSLRQQVRGLLEEGHVTSWQAALYGI